MSPSRWTSRPAPQRSQTWPPASRTMSDATALYQSHLGSAFTPRAANSSFDPFIETLEDHPDAHFLSPVDDSDDWTESDDDSSNEDDDDEIEWNAGITDFTLFDNDRRRAQETHACLPSRWRDLVANQTSALQRALDRSGTESHSPPHAQSSSSDDIPGLTPDSSPHLRDGVDPDPDPDPASIPGSFASALVMPSYLTVTVTPPEGDDRLIGDDDDLPLSFFVQRAAKPAMDRWSHRVPRPGLRHPRTMSGKAHVWRRPGWGIGVVDEDPEAERQAELDIEDDKAPRNDVSV